ncbi:MAG: hypothetical protein ACR2IP_10765 [Solirubrobacteraceae bacterium]
MAGNRIEDLALERVGGPFEPSTDPQRPAPLPRLEHARGSSTPAARNLAAAAVTASCGPPLSTASSGAPRRRPTDADGAGPSNRFLTIHRPPAHTPHNTR